MKFIEVVDEELGSSVLINVAQIVYFYPIDSERTRICFIDSTPDVVATTKYADVAQKIHHVVSNNQGIC